VALQRSGRTYKAPCPFHQERTPSFVVNPERGTWHCFGACATGGDVFQFLMRRENLTFGEALRQLAQQVGVELTGDDRPREDYSRLIEANEAAAAYFHQALRSAPEAGVARAYVEQRGVDAETLAAFQLGYAPESYEALRAHLTARGFTPEELVEAGLLTEGERGPYDRFRNRLIFPIRDERGRAIGFGGRVLGDGLPKYLNTPQTALFDKSGTLYALDRAKDAIHTAGSAVVVEGYMDAIAAHQYGIKNVVATLGTALTERHVQLLKRYTRRVTLAMDADAAGQEAMSRGLAVVDRAGADPDAPVETTVDWTGMVRLHAVAPVEVHVFTVPHGKDPDEAIRADPAAFTALAQSALPPFEFRLRHELAKAEKGDARALLAVADRLLPVVAGVSDRALQAHYLASLATATGTREDDLRARLGTETAAATRPPVVRERERVSRPARPPSDEPETEATAPAHGPVNVSLKREALLLRLLYSYTSLRPEGMLIEEELFTDAAHRLLFQAWRGSPDLGRVVDLLDSEMAAVLSAVLQERIPPFDDAQAARALADVVTKLRLARLEEQKRHSTATLHEGEAAADVAAAVSLARSFLHENGTLPETGAEAEAAVKALQDLELGVRFHQLEQALRKGLT
jgi:DNA primase